MTYIKVDLKINVEALLQYLTYMELFTYAILYVTELQYSVDSQAGAICTSDGLHPLLGVPDHWLAAHCLYRRTGSTNASLLPLLISSFLWSKCPRRRKNRDSPVVFKYPEAEFMNVQFH